MGKLNEHFVADFLQLLNVCLQENLSRLDTKISKELLGDGLLFIHSPKQDTFEVRNLEGPIAKFSMTELPGCCGVVVSYYSFVAPTHRNKGMGSLLLKTRMDSARRKGYGLMVATIDSKNKIEEKLLQEAGWRCVGEFTNPKTRNIIRSWSANL